MTTTIRVLALGDIVGRVGRRILARFVPQLRKEYNLDLVVANIENAAGGFGITLPVLEELRTIGIDIMTSGNHIYDKKEIIPHLDTLGDVLRPANYADSAPGNGVAFFRIDEIEIALINLQGRILMPWISCPFEWCATHLAQIRKRTPLILIDFHAEATSEKQAMGWYLDGTVSAVFGTHTHVPTADAWILPHGTGYITDIGMNGPYHSIIGMRVKHSLRRYLHMYPKQLDVARGPALFSGLYIEIDIHSGKTVAIEHWVFREQYDENIPFLKSIEYAQTPM